MAYDLCEFEECFFKDLSSPLSDSSSIDILNTFQENSYNLNPLTHDTLDTPYDETDQITPAITTSPPCNQLQSLPFNQMGNSGNSLDMCSLKIKRKEGQLPYNDAYVINPFLPHSENLVKTMQKSSNLQSTALASPDHGLSSSLTSHSLSSGPLATQGTFKEEANFKVGRYSSEERKVRILRYKAKRSQRNFNKTIKYACRKTLADNRPRIRGRFARNDESPRTFTSHYEYIDESWIEGLQAEDSEGITRRQFFNNMPSTQFHEFSYFP